MAPRKPAARDWGALAMTPAAAEVAPAENQAVPVPAAAEVATKRPGRPTGAGTRVADAAERHVLYLNRAGKQALEDYALTIGRRDGRKVKVHDLIIEALEAWARAKGIRAPMRVGAASRPPEGDQMDIEEMAPPRRR
ncbi:MAG: hypothetical protein HQL40_03295 [Alphaproteobacteria bacterium]|nr:hypothetical protein [Alphaproteobacteria bacterium]MBF0372145.1 hypothetical protein [Alphaproteobacteria bacterium]